MQNDKPKENPTEVTATNNAETTEGVVEVTTETTTEEVVDSTAMRYAAYFLQKKMKIQFSG